MLLSDALKTVNEQIFLDAARDLGRQLLRNHELGSLTVLADDEVTTAAEELPINELDVMQL